MKLFRFIGNATATIYFFFPMSIVLAVLLLAPLILLLEIHSIRTSSFSSYNIDFMLLGVISFLIAISMLVPPIRKLYWTLPWLYPFVKIMFVNFAILIMGVIILSNGYEVMNESRHQVYLLIMIAFIIVSRLVMCLYFKWRPLYEEHKAMANHETIEKEETIYSSDLRNKWLDKRLKWFGSMLLFIFLFVVFSTSTSTENTKATRDALETHQSTEITEGTVLLKKDENIGSENFIISHMPATDGINMWIWDYAKSDGDYVQVFINGEPYIDSFMIKNKPRAIILPTVGSIQIKGIKDGGQSITYAVRFDSVGISYFNSIAEGESNTFQLKR